jgi:hypothetical protein
MRSLPFLTASTLSRWVKLPVVRSSTCSELSGARVTAAVESASDGLYVRRLDLGVAVPSAARVGWYDGDAAWYAPSRLEWLGKRLS